MPGEHKPHLMNPTVVTASPLGRVTRWKRDRVGNDLTAELKWCDTHNEPVWVYGDGSFECPHDRIVQAYDDNHVIDAAPWERSDG